MKWLPVFRTVLAVALAALFAVAVPVSARAQLAKRVALVIGNGAYRAAPKLITPPADARLIAQSLKTDGFTLIGGGALVDLDHDKLAAAVQQLGQAASGMDVAVVYYAGHAVQVNGANYLVPVNASPAGQKDVDFQLVGVDAVLRQIAGNGTKLNIVLLDASRANPFPRALPAPDGLAAMRPTDSTAISFAAQPNSIAAEGLGNSAYAKALSEAMRQTSQDAAGAFATAAASVNRASGGKQTPYLVVPAQGSQFLFAAATPFAPAPAAAPAAAAAAAPAVAAPAGSTIAHLEAGKTAPAAPPPGYHCAAPGTVSVVNNRRYEWQGADPNNPNICIAQAGGQTVRKLFGFFDASDDSPQLEQALNPFFFDFAQPAKVVIKDQLYTFSSLGYARQFIGGAQMDVVMIKVETEGNGFLHLDHHVGTWTIAYDRKTGLMLKGEYLPKLGEREKEQGDWYTSVITPPQT